MTKIREFKESLKSDVSKIRELKAARKTGNATTIPTTMFHLRLFRKGVRYKHIAYSLLRGRTYEQIEKPREPLTTKEWETIEGIKHVYTEDVPACAA